jgi:hypothetical protein
MPYYKLSQAKLYCQPGNTLSNSRHFVTRGGKTQVSPPPERFFFQLQLDAMLQKCHTSCEASLVLTCVPQKNFDVKCKIFICVTFFSKSNANELLMRKCHSAPQMKFIGSGTNPQQRLLWGTWWWNIFNAVKTFLTQFNSRKYRLLL